MRLLLVFLKEPVPGKVKNHLAADVGEETATLYYRALVEILLKQLQGLKNTRIRFCYAPEDAHDAVRFWLLPQMNATSGNHEDVFLAPANPTSPHPTQEIDFRAQGDGDLGKQIHRAFAQGFEEGFESIALIGTDCPECGSRWINTAFARLDAKPSDHGIIGPCPDGSCYFLALKALKPQLFTQISKNQHNTLSATLNAAEKCQIKLEKLPPLRDIARLDDWLTLMDSPLGAAIKKSLKQNPHHPDKLKF